MARKKGVQCPNIVAFIYYPSDNPYHSTQWLLDKIRYLGFNAFVSPLHCPDEENKKPHHHVVIIKRARTGYELDTWRGYVTQLQGANNMVFVPDAPVAYCRYLLHLDNPEKEQFDKNVYTIGLISYADYSNYERYLKERASIGLKEDNQLQRANELNAIYNFIRHNYIVLFSELVDYIRIFAPLTLSIVNKYHSSFISYMRSLEYERRLMEKSVSEYESVYEVFYEDEEADI